jgi:hypothetical protein
MPRKSTKTASDAPKPPDQGVDTAAPENASEALKSDAEGKPEELPAKKKIGRPSKYTPEIAQQMCEMLSEGVPLREICRMDGFPYWRTVYLWMAKDENLSAHIARAREAGYDAMAEECLIIADNPQFGQKQTMTDEGTSTTVEDMLGHRKLRIETRLKLLAKWNPKKYGDRVTHAGDPEAPLEVHSEALGVLSNVLKGLEKARQNEQSS